MCNWYENFYDNTFHLQGFSELPQKLLHSLYHCYIIIIIYYSYDGIRIIILSKNLHLPLPFWRRLMQSCSSYPWNSQLIFKIMPVFPVFSYFRISIFPYLMTMIETRIENPRFHSSRYLVAPCHNLSYLNSRIHTWLRMKLFWRLLGNRKPKSICMYHESITELIMRNLKSQVMKLFQRPRTLMKIILNFSGAHHFFFFLITGDKVFLWPG